MEYTCLENDVEEEVESVAGRDTAPGEGCLDECIIKTLGKELKPVHRVPFRFHCLWLCLSSIFANTVLMIKVIESIVIPTVRIADKCVLIEIVVLLW